MALTVALAALAAGLVLLGRTPGTAEAFGSSVVPDDVRQAAMTLGGPEAGVATAQGDGRAAPAEAPAAGTSESERLEAVEFERTEDVEYVVEPGETLSEIADRFDLSYEVLAAYNHLRDPHTLVPGQRLVIPSVDAISDAGSTWIPAL